MMVIPRITMKRFLITFYGHENRPVFAIVINAVVSDLAIVVAKSKLPPGCNYSKALVEELPIEAAAV
jgi:hypothetical protein